MNAEQDAAEGLCARCAAEGYECDPDGGPVGCDGGVCFDCDHSFDGALRRDLPDPDRTLPPAKPNSANPC